MQRRLTRPAACAQSFELDAAALGQRQAVVHHLLVAPAQSTGCFTSAALPPHRRAGQRQHLRDRRSSRSSPARHLRLGLVALAPGRGSAYPTARAQHGQRRAQLVRGGVVGGAARAPAPPRARNKPLIAPPADAARRRRRQRQRLQPSAPRRAVVAAELPGGAKARRGEPSPPAAAAASPSTAASGRPVMPVASSRSRAFWPAATDQSPSEVYG